MGHDLERAARWVTGAISFVLPLVFLAAYWIAGILDVLPDWVFGFLFFPQLVAAKLGVPTGPPAPAWVAFQILCVLWNFLVPWGVFVGTRRIARKVT